MQCRIRDNIIAFPARKSFNYKSVTKYVWHKNGDGAQNLIILSKFDTGAQVCN